MFTLEVVGDKSIIARLDAMPDALHGELKRTVERLVALLQQKVWAKLQGPVLKHRTGKLARSIDQIVIDEPESIIGRVFSNGTVAYARIHEFGGVIHHPGGTAYYFDAQAGMAHFLSNAKAGDHDFPRTKPHDIPMPERSYMRSTLVENAAMIEKELMDAVARAAQGMET